MKYFNHFMRPLSGHSPHNNPRSNSAHNRRIACIKGSLIACLNRHNPPSISQATISSGKEIKFNPLRQNPRQIKTSANRITSSRCVALICIQPINQYFFHKPILHCNSFRSYCYSRFCLVVSSCKMGPTAEFFRLMDSKSSDLDTLSSQYLTSSLRS